MRSFECDAEFPTEPTLTLKMLNGTEIDCSSTQGEGDQLQCTDDVVFDAPCGTGKAYSSYLAWLQRFVPQTAHWVSLTRHRTRRWGRTRAHLNKFNRHKKRPNGRPRHR